MIRLTILKYNSDEQPCSSTICTATDAATSKHTIIVSVVAMVGRSVLHIRYYNQIIHGGR